MTYRLRRLARAAAGITLAAAALPCDAQSQDGLHVYPVVPELMYTAINDDYAVRVRVAKRHCAP